MELAELTAKIDASLHDVQALINVMRAATQPAGLNPSHPAFFVLASRNGIGGWSLLETLRVAVANKQIGRAAWMYLLPAIAHLKVTPAELCELVYQLRLADPSSATSLSSAVNGALRQNRPLGRASLEYAIDNRDRFDVNVVYFIAAALAGVDAESFLELLPILEQAHNTAADTAVLSGGIALAQNERIELLEQHLGLFRKTWSRAKDCTATTQMAWDLACRLADFDPASMLEIENAASHGPESAQHSICFWLMRTLPERWPKSGLSRIVRALLAAAMATPSIRQNVGQVLDVMLTVPAARSDFIQMCDILVAPGSTLTVEEACPDLLNHLASEPALFSTLLTRWLLRLDASLAPLRSMIQLGFLSPQLMKPDAVAFAQASADDQSRAIRRLLGLALDGQSICEFMFALAESPVLQPWAVDAFRDVVQNYVVQEFPAAAHRFLAEKTATISRESDLGDAVIQSHNALTDWQGVLERLPPVKELNLTEAERFTLNQMRIRDQRAIHRGAREKSVFAQMTTPMHVKQGQKVVVRGPGRPPEIMTMAHMSHGFELPRSESADPMLGQMRRAEYLGGT